jgi:hypothetical protein
MIARWAVFGLLLLPPLPHLANASIGRQECGGDRRVEHREALQHREAPRRVQVIRFVGGGVPASDRFEPASFIPADRP